MKTLALATGLVASFGFALPAAAAIDIQEVTTEAGFEAWLVEEESVPFVSLEIRFEGGAVLDPADKAGVTNLMVGLLEEGAGDLDARGFAAAQESLAASFSYDAGHDAVSVSARFLTENMDEVVALLQDSLSEPRFDEDAIERVRAQVMSGLRSAQNDPGEIAERRAAELAFGDHPYARPVSGTLESVPSLTRDDIVAAHETALVQDRVRIGASGDISAEELSELIDTLMEGLPETGGDLPRKIEVKTDGGVTVVPFDTPQSVAVFEQPGIDRHDEDFFPAYVMNEILGGGGFEARLTEEVRVKRGLTYGVYSYLATRDYADLVMGRVQSSNETVAEAVEVIRDEWGRMASEGVTEAELEQAKTYLTGAYPLRFDGNAAIASILVGMQMDDLTPDYVNTRNGKIEAVTVEDVKRVAGELLDPDALSFVVVGDPEGFDEAQDVQGQ
ncbi:zinc protease [Roseivivax halodurans JCM 10272]|uniref:Zinc protease n=1 Tax=Roseivivax halodurans JCM 10272 TaxID=1449350 RepID=X7ECP7_9RHOB|nr:pitrilysin family protein [Roseivivax halodurans]ETX13854.1 zinc protease [Roseivivax halodurans JCM 10272]